ncbi:MAG: hypothetical protein IJY09_04365 [Lachnospiraceae bacterium]|nr:hypothetical protein [Lachnospiraceae bacterium]
MPGRKKRQRNRERLRGNAGVSFIEVIISMLVLAIALVSLLGAFSMSFRINLKSRRELSASIVAQNVMECVKEYTDFHTVATGVSEEMKSFLPTDYAASFAGTADGFSLSSVREGSSEFQVVVKYDKQDFTKEDGTGINDYELPDLTTLNSVKTIILCPSGVSGGEVEEAATSFFLELWVAEQWALHTEEEEEGEEGETEETEDAEAGGEAGEDESETEEGAEDEEEEEYTGPTEAEVMAQLARIQEEMEGSLVLELVHDMNGYKMTADMLYEWDDEEWTAYHIDSNQVEELENVYVFYDPAQLESKGGGTFEIKDTITLKNFSKELDFFLAVQESIECLGVSASELIGPKLINEASTGPITVYSSTRMGEDLQARTGFEDAETLVARKKYERMQNVTVQVYLKSTGDLMATMETAISQ